MTNYEIWLQGDGGQIADVVLGMIERDDWMRPTVGQEIKLKGKTYYVVRADPSSNPPNVKVKYYVQKRDPKNYFR